MTEIRVYRDSSSLAQAAAELVIEAGAEAIRRQGNFSLALAGGSTPRATYALLAQDRYASRINWWRTFVFWGDERCVPPDHPESNYRMAQKSVLDHVPVPADQIYRMQGEISPQIAADSYERLVRVHFATQRPEQTSQHTFDLVLLGLGDDGHTASLFPGSTSVQVQDRWVMADYVAPLGSWRLTLTPPCINAAYQIAFLVSGGRKAGVLSQVISPSESETGDTTPRYPAETIQPAAGQLVWLVDEAAAAGFQPGM
jgi:6-phosphogluconolactonase